MNIIASKELLENPKLLSHLKEHSYLIKDLNRNYNFIREFKRRMKIIYKERPADKVNNALDGIDMISSIIDSVK